MTTTKNNEHKKLNFSSEREQNQACLNSAKHEKNQGRKVLNVPNLRFPEFQGEWVGKTIGDIAPLQRGFDLPTGQINNGKFPVVYSNGIMNYHSSYKCVAPGLITGRSGTIGKFTYIEDGYYWPHNTSLWVTNFYDNNPKFIYYLYQTIRIGQYSMGSGVPTLNRNNVHRHQTFIPKLEEQKKIATFLSLLDERIATQSKIIEDLKKLKSAIVEKVFCSPNQEYPMCRIEGFEQALSTYKMSDFSSRIATKNKDSKCSLVLTIAAQYGLVNQESFFNKSVASDNLTGYYLLHKGEFAYNRSYSAGYDWGAVKRLDNYDEGVLSTLYICFKINETIVDSDYLAYYFESTKWHRGLSDIAGEGARNHGLLNVSMADYFNTKHRFPVIEEQKAIAKILNAITEKERKATLLGECYQKQKQYLLRQMFI